MEAAEPTLERPRPSALINISAVSSHYSDEDRRTAVALYLEHGKASIVSNRTGIPETTLSMWRKQEWWDDLAAVISIEVDDRLRALLRESAISGQEKAIEKLDTASARDCAMIAAIAIDKLRLIDGKPTRITEGSKIDGLAAQLAKLSDQVNAKVVSDQ